MQGSVWFQEPYAAQRGCLNVFSKSDVLPQQGKLEELFCTLISLPTLVRLLGLNLGSGVGL